MLGDAQAGHCKAWGYLANAFWGTEEELIPLSSTEWWPQNGGCSWASAMMQRLEKFTEVSV